MVEWGDNWGRYRFAPHALERATPYIDRIEIQCDDLVVPYVLRSQVGELLNELGRGAFFDRCHQGKCAVRRGQLFAGRVSRGMPGEGGENARLKVVLSLNVTRFLQGHRVPDDANTRSWIEQQPDESLDARRLATSTALSDASGQTFDGRDNFLTHSPTPFGVVRHWDVRLHEYVSAVFNALEDAIGTAARRVSRRSANVGVAEARWFIKQAEYYFEFKVRDAIGKLSSISRTASQTLVDSYETDFPPRRGFDRNAPYVSGRLGHADIRAKLYAKSSGVIRFEVAYDRAPHGVIRSRTNLNSRGGILNLVALSNEVAQDATTRAERFWEEFWAQHSAVGSLSSAQIMEFFSAVERAAHGTQLPSAELLSLLVHRGGGAPFSPGRGSHDPLRRLKRSGIVVRVQTSSARKVRYRVKEQYIPLVALLFRHQNMPVDEEITRDEEPRPQGRTRPIWRTLEARERTGRPRRTRQRHPLALDDEG